MFHRNSILNLLWIFTVNIEVQATAFGAPFMRPTNGVLSLDQSILFVVGSDSDELVAVSTCDGVVMERATTNVTPTDVALVSSPNEVWVVSRFGRTIDRFDATTLVKTGTIDVPLYGERIAVNASGSVAYITNRYLNALLIIDTATFAITTLPLPGRAPRDLLVDDAGNRVYVAEFLSESVAVIDATSLTVVADIAVGALPSGLTLAGSDILVGHLGRNGSTADDAVTNKVSLIDRGTLTVHTEMSLPCATPRAAAGDNTTGHAWVACFGSDVVLKVDLNTGFVAHSVPVGPNPVAMLRHSDGRMFVLNELGDSISVINNGTVSVTWSLNPSNPGFSTAELRGERVFTTASALTNNTCYSCHPDGQTDNLSRFTAPADYLQSLVINTSTLRGVSWTAPYLRIGTVPTLGLREAIILPLVKGHPVNDLDLTDLVAYLGALGPPPNPFTKSPGTLTPLEAQGAQLFIQLDCASCHSTNLYTDHRRHDVGTGGDADTPVLFGLWATAPYLNDGRAATLEDVFAPLSGRHESWITDPAERAALAAYLLTIPNPQVFWRLPSRLAADGSDEALVEIQLFDGETGRAEAGIQVNIVETTGLGSVQIIQPAVTDAYGRTSGCIRATTPGTAAVQLEMDGEVISDIRSIDITAGVYSFVNVAPAAGLDFVVPPAAYPRAVAIADYDGDQLQDIFVAVSAKDPNDPTSPPHVGAPSHLFRNRGDGTFEDTTVAAGIFRSNRSSAGVSFGDYDHDGDLDLYIANRGAASAAAAINELYRNNGDGTFTDVTIAAGVANPGFSYSVLWFDFDHDGELDLYVENLTTGFSSEGNYTPDALYRNNGDGTFTDVIASTDAACTSPAGPVPCWAGLGGDGGAVGDYDDDGWQDVIKSDIDAPDRRFHVLRNLGNGMFEERWALSNLGALTGSRGLILGDFDNDRDLDLFAVGKGLYRNNGDTPRTFTNITAAIGFNFAPYRGERFGHTFADLNNDGWIDIVAENASAGLAVFMNRQGSGQFDVLSEVEPISDVSARPRVGLGVLDYDGDGDLDIFACKEGNTFAGGQPQVLYDNRLQNQNHFLRVTLEGVPPGTPRSANGARLMIEAGGLTQMREIMGGENASGAADYMQHVGLGGAIEVDRITVHWPSGNQDVFDDVPVHRHIHIKEAQAAWTTIRQWLDVDIAADVVQGMSPLTVTFSTVIFNAAGNVTYAWDFGDGAQATGPSTMHTFSAPGPFCTRYTPTVTLTDQSGSISTASIVVSVVPDRGGDFDLDCDHDLTDLKSLTTCLSGPLPSSLPGNCAYGDMDRDGDIDLADAARFFRAFAAP